MDQGLFLTAGANNFVWTEHMNKVLITAALSMVPTYEGRYAVASGIAMGMPSLFTYALAFVCSSIPIPIILLLLRPVLDWFYTLPIKPVRAFAAWLERRSARKREKMRTPGKGLMGKLNARLSQDTFELIALYVFVALPLPGTGVWTGSAIATLFEMPRLKSGIAILLGNATACLIMMLLSTGVRAAI
ncbi:MAG: hypothetical protein E7317_12010 [Clostridiales bacterium]|nr:hypothetical protein [Clostridiales bacterium]